MSDWQLINTGSEHATSHWPPRYIAYGVPRPQWVNIYTALWWYHWSKLELVLHIHVLWFMLLELVRTAASYMSIEYRLISYHIEAWTLNAPHILQTTFSQIFCGMIIIGILFQFHYILFQGFNWQSHYSDVIMSVMVSQITGVSIVYSTVFFQTQIKESIKAPRHWPLWGEFIGDRWIPRTKGQ